MVDTQLYCGDCKKVLSDFPSEYFDLAIIDPPYGIKYKSNRPAYNTKSRKTDNNFGDDVYDSEWFYHIYRVLKKDSFLFVFTRYDVLETFRVDATSAGFGCVQRLIWDKCHWGMGDLRYYGSQVEDILLFRKGSPKLRWEKRRGNIWKYPSKAYFPEGVYDHPAQKPLGVIEDWIKDASDVGAIVLDCFMGSGTVGEACVRTKRNFVGIDLRQKYYDMAKDRIEIAKMQ